MSEIKQAIEEVGAAFKGYRETTGKEIAGLTERLELLEAGNDRPGKAGGGDFSRKDREHKDVFCEWMRKPNDGMTKRRLDEAQHELLKDSEAKAVTVGTASAGGYAVPEIIDRQIEARVNLLNPFRSLVRVVQCGSRDYKQLVSSNDGSNGWAAEGGTRSETTTSRLFERAPTFGTLYAYPKASEESLQDIFFDVGAWLAEEAGDGFAAAEATAIVSGNGSSRPTGFLNSATVTTDDNASPERGAGVLEYLPITTPSSPVAAFTDTALSNSLIDLSLHVKEKYLLDGAAVAWVMRRSVAAKIRKLRSETDGQFLWQPGLAAGQPPTLLGYPVHLTDAMPAIAAGSDIVAFGNWRRGYLLADRVGTMQITVDANITTPGQVKYYIRRVVGGTILNHEALKTLKVED